MLQVVFAPRAVTDLRSVKEYIAENLFNPQAAAELMEFILAEIRRLQTFPLQGKQLETQIEPLKAYRFVRCKNYLVFYRADASTVYIIRVLYAHRDYMRLLGE